MAVPNHILEDLRDRVALSDLVGKQVKLIKRGREFLGLCPFHNEKTPSFTVSNDKGFYHCFGCNAHGSAFDFLMHTEGLSFIESVERVADLAGITLPPRSSEERGHSDKRAALVSLCEQAASWFEAQLSGPGGRAARNYLAARGLSNDTIGKFRIGFAPASRGSLKDAMLAGSVAETSLIEVGLLVKPNDEDSSYDRFRNRIIFPIWDRRGRIIAFGGRALGEVKPKYINSPETPLFHKGHILFGLTHAAKAIRTHTSVLVVEGYMDVIALAEAGHDHVVAPLGTAITEDQIRDLWRLAPEPTLCLDGDEAGLRAAVKAAERALPLLRPGCSLRFALLPEGEDPDSLVRRGGISALERHIDSALPLAEVLWRNAISRGEFDTPERRAALEHNLREQVGRITDSTVRGYYRDYVKERIVGLLGGKYTRVTARRPGNGGPRRRLGGLQESASYRRERLLIVTVINHPKLMDHLVEDFAHMPLGDVALDGLRTAILEITDSVPELNSTVLKDQLINRGLEEILQKVTAPAIVLDWFARTETALEDAGIGWKHALALHQRAVRFPQELEDAEREFGVNPNNETEARLLALKREEERVEGHEAQLEQLGVASGRKTTTQ